MLSIKGYPELKDLQSWRTLQKTSSSFIVSVHVVLMTNRGVHLYSKKEKSACSHIQIFAYVR